jgi:hypothetical protein
MAATYNKINDFVEQLCKGVHQCHAAGHTFKVALTNTAPVATNTILADLTEISAGNGYSAGGVDTQNDLSETSGTATCSAVGIVITAAGGTIGPFRYIVLYNDSATSPADALIAWWDYSSSISLLDGETFTITFGSSSLFTLA